MGIEFRCICKDCQVDFGYSEASIQAGTSRGLSRPERCPACRRIHSREGKAIGISQIPLSPIGRRKPDSELIPGRLGKIIHPERPHRRLVVEGKFGKPDSLIDFGITDDDIRNLFNIMRNHQVVVVVGPTGSGKSTFLPYRLMVPPDGIETDLFTRYGQIAITQPRTQATRSIAAFVAKDLHGSSLGAGFDVGFRHRDAPMSDWRNKLVYLTDGTLINWIRNGELDKLSVIMIDEAHERSLNIDLILGLLKQQLPRYPMLKLIIASATINAELFQNYYGGAEKVPLITFRGLKQFSVEAFFPPGDDHLRISRDVPKNMADRAHGLLLKIAKGEKEEGDILCFLPGAEEIKQCIEQLRAAILETEDLRGWEIGVYPLYSTLSQDALDLALAKKTHVIRERVLHHIESTPQAYGYDQLLILLLDRKSANEAKGLVDNALAEKEINGWHTWLLPIDESAADVIPGRIIFATYEQIKTIPGRWRKDSPKVITDRRVIISTNVAETSLTVDGIVYVIDSGLIKESRWDPVNGAKELPTHFHSRAGCRQRWGRAGRVRDGEAHMLYTDSQFEDPDIFPPHTEPEIRRSCLETIVLTAKAAGINDIASFDWIQPPPQTELTRAPAILENMGALDDEGDLTDFGMELQSFMAEIPIASLIVATDRFACGVEMATLAALLEAQIRNLLLNDWRWDFETRAAVKKIHSDLAASCGDDLEWYFKLYSIYAETSSHEMRSRLCKLFFINEEAFTERVQKSRQQFMEMLAIGKKSEEDRTIAFTRLEKFRFVLALTLPDSFLFRHKDGVVFSADPSIKIPIEIYETSVAASCLPSCFIALGRRIVTKESVKSLVLSCLIRVDESWLALRGKGTAEFAIYIAKHFSGENDDGTGMNCRARIFADVLYPLGSVWTTAQQDGARNFPERMLKLPKPLKPVINEERMDSAGGETETDIGDIDPRSGFEDKEDRLIAEGEEVDEQDTVLEYEDEGIDGLVVLPEAKLKATQFDFCVEDESMLPIAVCQIVAHQIDEKSSNPIVILSTSNDSEVSYKGPTLIAGQHYIVRGEKVLDMGGRETALQVSLKESPNQKYIIGAGELSFSGRFEIPGRMLGKEFEALAVEKQGEVRLTRLPLVEEGLSSWLAGCSGKQITCELVSLNGHNGNVLFTDLERELGFAEMAYAYLGADSKKMALADYSIGGTYDLFLKSDYGQAHEPLYLPSASLLEWIEVNKGRSGIFYNRRQKRLHTTKPLAHVVREELAGKMPDANFATILARLYRHSNKVTMREFKSKNDKLDYSKSVALEEYRHAEVPLYSEGENVRGRISEIRQNGVTVVMDQGGRGYLPMNYLAWDSFSFIDPRELVSVGQEIDAKVLTVETSTLPSCQNAVSIKLTMLREEDIPSILRTTYAGGTVHDGQIVRLAQTHAIVRLDSGITGILPPNEVVHGKVEEISDHLRLDQSVQVKILRLKFAPTDPKNPINITFSIKALMPCPEIDCTKYIKGSEHKARITHINDARGFALAELESGITGFIHVSELSYLKIGKVSDVIRVGENCQVRVAQCDSKGRKITLSVKNAFHKKIKANISDMKRIIGPSRSTVKGILETSGCLVDCNFETGVVSLNGPSAPALTTAEDSIRKILAQHPKEAQKTTHCTIQNSLPKKSNFSATASISQNKIGLLIGSKGTTIKKIKTESGCSVFCDDDGKVSIKGKRRHDVQHAVRLIQQLIRTVNWDEVITENR